MTQSSGAVVIVLDTSVLISALISQGTPPQQLYLKWMEGVFRLLTSTAQVEEFTRVIEYDRLKKYIRSPTEAREMLQTLQEDAEILQELPDVHISPDPDDNAILATAIAGKADYLVSGDKGDLLGLGEIEGVPIVTARMALRLIEF